PPSLAGPIHEVLARNRPALAESLDEAITFHHGDGERAYLPRISSIHDPYGGTIGAAIVLADVTRFRLLDQVKSDLVAPVSHELKPPLTSVRLGLHLLLEEAAGPLISKQSELLLEARDNAERLLAMIEKLLALARLEQARDAAPVSPHSAADLLRAAAAEARPRAENRHLELLIDAADDLPPVAADPARLSQALSNLLDNALTYPPPGGTIRLSARVTEGGQMRLSVSDTGPGIPPEYLPRVFDRFFRVPGQSAPSGTGLGLAIV